MSEQEAMERAYIAFLNEPGHPRAWKVDGREAFAAGARWAAARGVRDDTGLREAAEIAVTALIELLPLEGSWERGYKITPTVSESVHALPSEWAEAAHAIAALQAVLAAAPVSDAKECAARGADEGCNGPMTHAGSSEEPGLH